MIWQNCLSLRGYLSSMQSYTFTRQYEKERNTTDYPSFFWGGSVILLIIIIIECYISWAENSDTGIMLKKKVLVFY